MPIYVEIAVNVPQVSGEFHYHLPAELEKSIAVGQLVSVPFGRQIVQGVVTGFVDTPSVQKTREVLDIIDPAAVLTPSQLQFAQELAHETLSSLAASIALMLPPGLAQQADVLYTPQISGSSSDMTAAQSRLINLLRKRGPLRGQQIDRSLSRMNWRAAARALVRKGMLKTETVLPTPKVRPKYIRTAQLACPPEAAEKAMPDLAHNIRTVRLSVPAEDARGSMDILARPDTKALSRRQLMLQFLVDHPGEVEASRVYKESGGNLSDLQILADRNLVVIGKIGSPALKRRQAMLRFLLREPEPVDVTWLYAESGGSLDDLHALEKLGLAVLGESEVWRDPVGHLNLALSEPPPLTQDQHKVWSEVELSIHKAANGQNVKPILLHGVTGSGKTEIYLHAVQETLNRGKQAIVLVPEIALTPQTIRRFAARFPGQVGLLHSGLSQGERYDTWRRARAGELVVMVGPRSALFTPFDNLGLIVVDESHDGSYYQSDPEPHYHARQAAITYAQLVGALCIFGSATPDIVSYYHSQTPSADGNVVGKYNYQNLPSRILAHRSVVKAQLERLRATSQGEQEPVSRYSPYEGQADSTDLPQIKVVDMRRELKSGNRSIFSTDLADALERVFDSGQQAILFLNRRGTATYIFCRDCGHSLRCPRCDIPLTYHGPQAKLVCHHCGYKRNNPSQCPACGSERIRHFGTGTESVEAAVQAQFPQARTLRWDYETTRKKGAHDMILSHFSAHRANVLIGTQMLAKGLDLPLVTLVGVILADVGLNLPDYRSSERTFQVLTQVAGRAGRSPLGGSVILQTFQPDHYVIEAAAEHNYRAFYQREIRYRRDLDYPPYSNLVRLENRDLKPDQAESAANAMAVEVKRWIEEEGRRATSVIGPVPCFFARIGGHYRWQIVLRGPDPASLLRGRTFGKWKVSVNPPNLL